MQRLLSRKADVNAVNEHGNTPLHYAAFWGYENILADLINAGATLALCNKYEETAADICRPSAHKVLMGEKVPCKARLCTNMQTLLSLVVKIRKRESSTGITYGREQRYEMNLHKKAHIYTDAHA